MERRLIDANALEHHMAERVMTLEAKNGPYDHYTCGYQDAIDDVEDAPTIDAVEVVRCRDCAYMHVPRCCPYQIAGFKVDDDWYCPMGVRRKPDEDNLHG